MRAWQVRLSVCRTASKRGRPTQLPAMPGVARSRVAFVRRVALWSVTTTGVRPRRAPWVSTATLTVRSVLVNVFAGPVGALAVAGAVGSSAAAMVPSTARRMSMSSPVVGRLPISPLLSSFTRGPWSSRCRARPLGPSGAADRDAVLFLVLVALGQEGTDRR